MKTVTRLSHHLLICATVLVVSNTWSQPRPPSPWNPAAAEMARLPKYCWAQFNPAVKAQGHPTPMDLCGVGMNHLCPGLVGINRAANATFDRQYRKNSLGQAENEINYTVARVPASCPIASDVQAAQTRIKALKLLLK